MNENIQPLWKSKVAVYQDALVHVMERQQGKITGLNCKLDKLNSAFVQGFEWGTASCFASRPAMGKSTLKEQLIREFFSENPNEKFRVLDWDLEMLPMITALREFSSVIGKSYKYVCYAEIDDRGMKLDHKEWEKLKTHVKEKQAFRVDMGGYPIDIIENPTGVDNFEKQCSLYLETYADQKVVITLDHARLLLKEGRSEQDMLQDLGHATIRMKKKYPGRIIFIIFNHVKREVMDASRCEDGSSANLIVDSDIFGGDSFSQNMDCLVTMDRPALRAIKYYTRDRFIIDSTGVMVFNFLKVRNGDPRISFFRGEFDKMRIVEMETPACAKKVSKMDEQRNE